MSKLFRTANRIQKKLAQEMTYVPAHTFNPERGDFGDLAPAMNRLNYLMRQGVTQRDELVYTIEKIQNGARPTPLEASRALSRLRQYAQLTDSVGEPALNQNMMDHLQQVLTWLSQQPQQGQQVQGSSKHNLIRKAEKIDSPVVLQQFLRSCLENSNARVLISVIDNPPVVSLYVCGIKEELIEKTERSLQEYVENLLKRYNIITTIPLRYGAGQYCMGQLDENDPLINQWNKPQAQGSAVHNLVRIAKKIRRHNALGTPVLAKLIQADDLEEVMTFDEVKEMVAGEIQEIVDKKVYGPLGAIEILRQNYQEQVDYPGKGFTVGEPSHPARFKEAQMALEVLQQIENEIKGKAQGSAVHNLVRVANKISRRQVKRADMSGRWPTEEWVPESFQYMSVAETILDQLNAFINGADEETWLKVAEQANEESGGNYVYDAEVAKKLAIEIGRRLGYDIAVCKNRPYGNLDDSSARIRYGSAPDILRVILGDVSYQRLVQALQGLVDIAKQRRLPNELDEDEPWKGITPEDVSDL
jgi:hypothetical protein